MKFSREHSCSLIALPRLQRERVGRIMARIALGLLWATLVAAPTLARPDSTWTQLGVAIISGDTDEVSSLLDTGWDVNERSAAGLSILHFWAFTYSVPAEIGQLLLDHGAEVNVRDAEGKMPLHRSTDESKTQILLEAGAEVNVRDAEGKTPLHHSRDKSQMQILLEAGAEVNARDAEGLTPLHLAAIVGSVDRAQILLDHGADMHAPDALFVSALDYASAYEETEILQLFLGGDADSWDAEARRNHFQLYNACKPLDIAVTHDIGESMRVLVEEEIEAALESRLRAARLYDSESSSYLSIYVQLLESRVGGRQVGWVYATDFEFVKRVRDKASGISRLLPTWKRGHLGIAPDSGVGDAILGIIRGSMDQFLADYLRVNESMCE